MNQDVQHLRLLSIFHYVVGGLMLVIASIPLIHFTIGVVMVFAPGSMGGSGPPPRLVGLMFMLIAGSIVVLGWALAIGMMLAGRFLSQRKHYMYCLIIAGFSMLVQPFGTILGIFTLIVLIRPSVKRLFETGEAPYDPEEDDEIPPLHNHRITSGSYNIHSSGG
jgi:hypothetical protein